MKKDFIEYDGDIKMAPNDVKDILEYLTNVLDNYEIKLKNELLDEFEVQRESNLLKDVLCNALVMINGRDKVNRVNNCNGEINIDYLITLLLVAFSRYSFGNEIKMFDNFEFSKVENVYILVKFLNYISLLSGYDRVFDIRDLITKYQDLCREDEINKLKDFSLKVNNYCLEIIENGARVDELIKKYFLEKGIYRITNSGTIYYSREYRMENNLSVAIMVGEEAEEVLTEVDAIICAYYKCLYGTGYNYRHGLENSQISKNKLVHCRIKRMKMREEY